MTDDEKKLLDAAKVIVGTAHHAARKIRAERERGAGYYHAEVDWLVSMDDAMVGWLMQSGAGLGLSFDDGAKLAPYAAHAQARREAAERNEGRDAS